jgi:anti-sigma B factor antagonist
MTIETHQQDGVTVVVVKRQRVDAGVAAAFKDELTNAVKGGSDRVVVDMSGVTFVDSSGLGAMIAVLKASPGHRLCVAGLTPAVSTLFRLTRMDKVFKVQPTQTDAVRELKAA